MEWKEYFLGIAEQVKLKSKDRRTQIGAVIVGVNNEIVSTGYNSFPRGIKDDVEERQIGPEKYFWFEHAERNAIYNAALIGASTRDCVMYVTSGVPCPDCTRGIINSGIKKVICKAVCTTSQPMWKEHAKRSVVMLEESNIELEYYE